MNKYLWLVRKEFLILVRDIPGLVILFVMPALLILIISLAQENVNKYSAEARTPLLFVNNSHSVFSVEIEKSIMASGFYELIKQWNGNPLKEENARILICRGECQAGLVIEKNDSVLVLILDPATVDIFHPARIRSLTWLIKGTEYRLAVQKAMPAQGGMSEIVMRTAVKKMTPVDVLYPEKDRATIKPTITQNNIPGYILFAMFLVVIPVAGNMVNEKGIGYRTRFMTLPVNMPIQLFAKISLYMVICLSQFFLMFIIGWFIFPGFSGYLNVQPWVQYPLLVIAAAAAALGATGFGILVGSISSTHGQAALFGPLMVVILASLSGAFLPVYLMPGFLRSISTFSPLYWGIENFITVFFRQGTIGMILPKVLLLILFFILSLTGSVFLLKRRK